MDLVSNYIGELAKSKMEGHSTGVSSGIDLNDNTFSNLLEKQLNNTIDNTQTSQISDFSIPSGLDIGDFDGNIPNFNYAERISSSQETADFNYNRLKNAKDYSVSEILTFFPSLFDMKPSLTETVNNGLYDFERKMAASSYGHYAKSIITDLKEFITDTVKVKS